MLGKLLLAWSVLGFSVPAVAGEWSFLNASINYLDWTPHTEDRTNAAPYGHKKDFSFLEVEGGRGGEWGDLYGFFDVENPTNQTDNRRDSRSDRRTAVKAVARFKMVKLAGVPVYAYGHVYDFVDNGFGDQNRVLGLGTDVVLGKFTLKPFLGAHNEVKSGVGAKANGGMAGYVMIFPFTAFHQALMVSQWHETEFARRDEFLDMALGGDSHNRHRTSENGALSLWWNATSSITAGVSYRYAENKLGVAGYEDGLIYTLRYNL